MSVDTELDLLFKDAKPAVFQPSKPLEFIPPVGALPSHVSSKDKKRKDKKEEESPSNSQQKEEETKKKIEPDSPEKLARTLFVGNIPKAVVTEKSMKTAFKKVFAAFGEVESVRFRSIAISEALPKKVGVLKGKLHEKRESCNGYVVMRTAEAIPAIISALNGSVFEGRHLRVDSASADESAPKLPTKKSIFVGNLPLTVDEESLWKIFQSCGPIEFVRVVRDKETGLGKGFGFIAFKEKATVELALRLDGTDCEGRPVRISKCAKPGYHQIKKARLEKLNSQNNDAENSSKDAQSKDKKSFARDQRNTKSKFGEVSNQKEASWKMPKLTASVKPQKPEKSNKAPSKMTTDKKRPQSSTTRPSASADKKARKTPKHLVAIRHQNREPKHPAELRLQRKRTAGASKTTSDRSSKRPKSK